MAKRQYDTDYIKYGFSYIEDKREGPKSQCVVCSEVLAHESMKPSKMKQHLETKHSAYKDKPVEYFQRRLQDLRASQKCLTSSCSKQEQALRASYHVAHRIAKSKKPHTIAEDLILPAAVEMVREVLDQSAADKLKTVPLSNDTISRRGEEMSDDIKQQTTARIKARAHYALQMDESTDIANHAILLVYVRHVWEGDLQEQFLCTRDLPTTTTAEDIFSTVDLYLGSVGLSWDMCVGITIDGAASMTGKNSGGREYLKRHRMRLGTIVLHREALAAKDMVPVLHETLKDVVKVVNHIKRSAKNARCFQKLCKDLGSEHVQVLYHAEVRWLSRGKVVSRFYELRTEIAVFLSENNSPLADLFSDDVWLAQVAHLADVFEQLNTLNVSMQGRGHKIFEQSDKIEAFKKKIALWANHVSKNRLDMFPNACREAQLDTAGKNALKKTVTAHLTKLQDRFNDYFPEKHGDDDWVRNPFGIDLESVTLPSNEESQLVELSCDQTLKKKFTELKTKQRNRLDIEHDLRVALSTITPDFETLVRSKKHPQLSH
uniref:protein FAM200B-like n=1 Tax=Centroberyx gerrardi TaxID=166262 RepID=UPI003AAEA413